MTDKPLLRSPLFETQRGLGARFVPYAGWELPVQFQGILAEHLAVRERAGLFDVTHMGRLRVTGTGALLAVDRLVTNSLIQAPTGRAVYGCCCNDAGHILDDLICYREADDRVFVICNAANREKIYAHFSRELPESTTLEDVSDRSGLLALQGPLSLEILETMAVPWVKKLHRMGFAKGILAEADVTIALTGYTGELGAEIICEREALVSLYSALLTAGAPYGIAPAGLGCRDTLRLEARLSLYGNEIDETTNPLEAGLGWTVKLDKPDFIGKDALISLRHKRPQRIIVGLEMLGRGIARHGYVINNRDGHPVGYVTSGAPSPTLGKNIALGYVPLELATVGTQLKIDCRGKLIDAKVVPTPFYKRAPLG